MLINLIGLIISQCMQILPYHMYVCVHLCCSVVSNSLRLHGLLPTRLPCPPGFSRQEYWSGLPCPPPRGLPNPRIKPRSPPLHTDSLLSEPPWKPKDTRVGSLSLLQGIFPTQDSNQGLCIVSVFCTSRATREAHL